MELQALRYAEMVSTMTFSKIVSVHEAYLKEKFPNVKIEYVEAS
jgi:hypothetical protein